MMIKMHCRHCGNAVTPRQIKVKAKGRRFREAWCPDCDVAIKSMNAAEQQAAAAPELDGCALPPGKAYKAGQCLKKMKMLWRKLHPADRFRFYEWVDQRERQEANGQA